MLIMYFIINGVAVEQAIRSTDGVNYDTFKSMAECEAQAKRDVTEILIPQLGDKAKSVRLVCEKR